MNEEDEPKDYVRVERIVPETNVQAIGNLLLAWEGLRRENSNAAWFIAGLAVATTVFVMKKS